MSKLATPAGTARYAARLKDAVAPRHFRRWPRWEEEAPDQPPGELLHLSSLGLGSYTGADDAGVDQGYADAVAACVRLGVNVIDSAINYRHMRSERALGAGLRALFERGEAARDEVFVMTKGGYLPFDAEVPADPAGYLKDVYIQSGLLRPADIAAGCHAISPRYLDDQIARSLANFGLDALDVYFLHNPEQQLEEVPREEFDRRIAAAFRFLEEQVRIERIGFYGAATWNGFRVPPESPEHLSLERLWQIAAEVAGEGHHFRVVQLPFNPAMPEALTQATQTWQGQRVTFLELADALGLLVVTSVPLLQSRILPHLPPSFAEGMPGLHTDAQRALQFARSTPGVHAPLVGMSQPAHVSENVRVVGVDPLDEEAFAGILRRP